ncbi:hypothetical protein NQ317_016920 [Molorchus minor]|uniref:Dual specificity protein phosphatase 19 n=1 Tax=Molorchus minor TaxID=1323400 RepID=A0ABQ9K3W0_9CUCU|nr:hypothetical protein NQ317_016920 [Molorchus minor]
MSFLKSLQAKKRNLKSTETYITSVDGRRFKQTKDEVVEVEKPQYGYVVDTKPDDTPSKIIDHIYLGSQDCCDEKVLREYGITYVLSIGIEAPVQYPNITYKFVECLDLPESDLVISLSECIPFIKRATYENCNILVHCNAGVSRSPSVVVGYLILVEKLSYVDAYNTVKK